jgi:hypothetical protein
MRAARRTRAAGLRRGVPAVLAAGLMLVATLAGSGQAQAAGLLQTVGRIITIAGGPGGPAVASKVAAGGCGLNYAAGRLYLGEGLDVQAVSTRTDWLTTVAGNDVETDFDVPFGAGPATRAYLYGACAIAVDSAGNLVVTSPDSNRVWLVAAATGRFYGRPVKAGYIYPVAGTGTCGFSGEGGPARSAEFCEPGGVAVDGAGNLVISDSANDRIRVLAASTGNFYGQAMTAGDVYTVAGTGTSGFSGNRGPATSAELDNPPRTLASAYRDAGYFECNIRTIEVLIDRDAVTSGQAAAGQPWQYYDLGHGLCSYTFFEQCPHRMACAKCDFYTPKDSSKAQLLEAKDNLQRMLTGIALIDDERAAVDDGQAALDQLLARLADVPTLSRLTVSRQGICGQFTRFPAHSGTRP